MGRSWGALPSLVPPGVDRVVAFRRVAGGTQPGKNLEPNLLGEAAACQEVMHGFHLLVAEQAAGVVVEAPAL
jgi:hypothetical protein